MSGLITAAATDFVSMYAKQRTAVANEFGRRPDPYPNNTVFPYTPVTVARGIASYWSNEIKRAQIKIYSLTHDQMLRVNKNLIAFEGTMMAALAGAGQFLSAANTYNFWNEGIARIAIELNALQLAPSWFQLATDSVKDSLTSLVPTFGDGSTFKWIKIATFVGLGIWGLSVVAKNKKNRSPQ